jgi:hypothetical protein
MAADYRGIRARIEAREVRVAETLAEGVASRGCPCDWPQFAYWAGKEHPPRSMDEIQNDLVKAALRLPFFTKTKPATPEYGREADARCTRCGARWKHISIEWRMMAFHERLLRDDGVPVPPLPAPPPRGPSPDEWAAYMRGEPTEGEHGR